jgi:hypothetical protein
MYEAFLVVVADAQELRLVLQVIVQHQKIRVEIGSVRHHHVERRIVEKRAVLDRSASRLQSTARAPSDACACTMARSPTPSPRRRPR